MSIKAPAGTLGVLILVLALSACDGRNNQRWNCVTENEYTAAQEALRVGDQELASGHYEKASWKLKVGLGSISYRSKPLVNDDNSILLLAAEVSEKQGKFETAAHARRSILSERIAASTTPQMSGCILQKKSL